MADKDLGALVVRLIADVSSLRDSIKDIEKVGDATEEATTKIDNMKIGIEQLAEAIPSLIANYISLQSVMKIDSHFVEQISIQEKAMARFGSAIRATQGVAGLSVQDFDKMSDTLAKGSTRTRAEIANLQSVLVAFTNIRESIFEDTAKTVINLSDAFEMDIMQVARSVGKALQNPITGMLSLQRIGLGLTPVLQAQVKEQMAMNDVLGAQTTILEFLETRLDYTSEMLSRTMPGAIAQTKRAWNDLFRISGTEGVKQYTQSLLRLRDTLQTDDMKSFVSELGSAFFTLKSYIINVINFLTEFKEILLVAFSSAVVITLATTIKTLLIPAFKLMGTAATVAFGPIGVVGLALVPVLMQLLKYLGKLVQVEPIPESVVERMERFGRAIENLDVTKLKQIQVGAGVTSPHGSNIKTEMYDPRDAIYALIPTRTEDYKENLKVIAKKTYEMTEQAAQYRAEMTGLLNEVKYNGKSVTSALADVNKEINKMVKEGTKTSEITGHLSDAYVVLMQTKETLEIMSGKSLKNYAKASKEAFNAFINGVKNQMELLGTPGETFLPGLKGMLKQFPELSEKWVTLKKLINSIEDERIDKIIKNAEIERKAKEKAEEYLADVSKKRLDEYATKWSKLASLSALNLIDSDTYIKQARDEFNRIVSLNTAGNDVTKWTEEQIKAYERVHNAVITKITPVMDVLNDQLKDGKISVSEYVQALEELQNIYSELPGVGKAIEIMMNAQIEAMERARTTLQSLTETALKDMKQAFLELPEALANAGAEALIMGNSIGDALQQIGRELEVLAVKAMILEVFKGLFGDSWTGFISSIFKPFAKGGVVTSPTVFGSAPNFGVMGEAGPEGIFPLTTTKDGKLGVTAVGGGGSPVYAPVFNVNVENKGFGEMNDKQAAELGTKLNAMVKVEVAESLYEWKRKGAFA